MSDRKQVQRKIAFSLWSLDGCTISEAIEYLKDLESGFKAKYFGDVKIDIDITDNDSSFVYYTMENDSEYKSRIERESIQKMSIEEKEKKEYERLREKYGNK